MSSLDRLVRLWSTTRFEAGALSRYAEEQMVGETRQGVMTLSALFGALLLCSTLVHRQLGLAHTYVYTAIALTALCAHVFVSARALADIRTLHALGMTLLIISGTAFVLLAHQHGGFGAALFTSVALLFMVIPLVPWGLREASLVTFLIYGVFSSSTWTVAGRFDGETLWTLQAFMLAAGVVSLTLVARSASVRKEDIQSRFQLEQARREMERLSHEDPLTGAWNRRFLEVEFPGFIERVRQRCGTLHFALLDIDRFKQLNDGFGHAYGDRVLQWVGQAFRTHLGDTGIAVRVGGDEFVLVFGEGDPHELIEEAMSTVRARAQSERSGEASDVSVSVGIVALPPEAAAGLDEVYQVADGALYRAKRSAKPDASGVRVTRVELAPRKAADA